jgi:hypothetical protein
VEPNQVDLLAATVLRGCEEIVHAVKPGLTRQIVGDVGELNRLDRIDDDVAVVHRVAPADFHLQARPDADGAADSAAADAFAQAPREDHQRRSIDSSWRR